MSPRTRYSLLAAGMILLGFIAAEPAHAVSFYLSPDVPGKVSAITPLPWLILRNDSGAYSIAQTLPQFRELDGIHRLDSGKWLLSFEAPATIGAVTFDPRDVVAFDGSTYAVYWSGAAAGVPRNANVDAVLLNGSDFGDLIVSFDVPVTIAGNTYDPADLVRWNGVGFSLYFDASAAVPPIPRTTNLNDAALMGSTLILTFEAPVTLGATTYKPGELVSWNGAAFALYYADPAWPKGVSLGGLALIAAPGEVSDTLSIDKLVLAPGNIRLKWKPSCSVGGEDYGIYEGKLGAWYSHTRLDCHDDGTPLIEEVTPGAGNRYYLVVPMNPSVEGSYGAASSGAARPVGTATCRTTQMLTPCP